MNWRWALLAAWTMGTAYAQCPPGAQLQYSSDVPATLGAVFVYDHDAIVDDGSQLAAARFDWLPERVDLDALHMDSDYAVLFSLDTFALVGGVALAPADLARRRGGPVTRVFDAAAAGVPRHVGLDAATRRGASLLLSFDTAFTLGGTFILPADVVEFSGTSLVGKVVDAAALGLSPRLNIDAVDASIAGTLLLSFDSGGNAGAPPLGFADEDVLGLVLPAGTWSKPCAMAARSDRWVAANLDALAASPAGMGLFKDGYEDGGLP